MLSRPSTPVSSDEILNLFLTWLDEQSIEMYDHQEEAILELFDEKNVILNTPTGSGKSLVALAMQYRALCLGRVAYYTVPIKALANEKFLSLCHTFGAENVGLITGDATVNSSAPIICCTAEILSNLALRQGADTAVNDVIMDEFHYYSDNERGVAWQVPLLTLPNARFLLMSATLGETEFFIDEIEQLTGTTTALVQSDVRPVPLHFDYSEDTLEEKIEELAEGGKAPVYLVNFTQLACAQTAQSLLSRNFCTKEEKREINVALQGVKFNSPYGKELAKVIRHGVGIHHAGLLPKYRLIVEKLAQRGLLKVICGTDTLGVGVNVPIRTVVFTQLCKYDGEKTGILAVRDFKQICGRAGRKGFDDVGYVVAQAPAHNIENIKLEAKAAGKGKKFVKKKPPERGFVQWDEKTFRRLIESPPEPLKSSFKVSHSMLLNVLARPNEDGCAELKRLIAASHEPEGRQQRLLSQARALFMGLVRGKVLTIIPPSERKTPAKIRIHVDLQEDFSMNQALALYMIETIPSLDQESPEYALHVLSLVEAILENPQQILRSQVRKAKDRVVAEMKEDGSSYEARMEALLEVSWPKPDAEFIYDTFNQFIVDHPWIEESSIRPKSIAREMFENFQSFDDYVREYSLEKSEAILLRHLSEVYRVLNQTVPPAAKTEELTDAEHFFGDLLRGVDSSLLDEWEVIRSGDPEAASKEAQQPAKEIPFTRKKKEFERAVRTAMFELVKAIAHDSPAQLLDLVEPTSPDDEAWDLAKIDALFDDYYASHSHLRLDPEARNTRHLFIEQSATQWKLEQVLIDGEGENDWSIHAMLDLTASDEQFRPVLTLSNISVIGSAH